MVAVEAAHEMSARDVVPAKAVEVQLRGAVQVVRRLRPHLVEVDLHIGVDGFDRGPGARADVVVAKAVDVDEIELRERRRIGGDESGGSAVIDEQRRYEFSGACRGRGSLKRQSRAQEKKRTGRGAQREGQGLTASRDGTRHSTRSIGEGLLPWIETDSAVYVNSPEPTVTADQGNTSA